MTETSGGWGGVEKWREAPKRGVFWHGGEGSEKASFGEEMVGRLR
jgi:hypothetical protein